jgi:hypothetical protein
VDPIVFAGDLPSATIHRHVQRGLLRPLARGVYTSESTGTAETIVRRHWTVIAARLFPDSVITDRSASSGRPVGGRLYLAHDGRERITTLPGLVIDVRRGVGPLDDDVALPGGLYLASRPRALAENVRPSRARGGKPRRTLDADELGDWFDRLCRIDGDSRLNSYRTRAEELAPILGVSSDALASLTQAIGVALGSRRAHISSGALAARQAGRPYDADRVDRFDRLVEALRNAPPQSRPVDETDPVRYRFLPFFEAYFSNYIEGTEFALREAEALVFNGQAPAGRTADAHDLMGTYRVVANDDEMARTFTTATDFCDALRERHQIVMAGRPDKHPGEFKTLVNQVGATLFVSPELVRGTLVEGFARLGDLDTAWERSVCVMFVVAEVHPFDDGNGRVARIMMNAELTASGESRVIIPTVYRSDYLGALRRLTRDDDPTVLVKAMRFAHDYTASIAFDSLDGAEDQLRRTAAFEDADGDRRLRLPSRQSADEFRWADPSE